MIGSFFMNPFTNNLIFSLNATVPVFLIMVFGGLIKKAGIIDENTTDKINNLVFKVLLPVLLFKDLSTADFLSVWDTKFVLFCIIATLVSIGIAALISLFHKYKAERGEIIQASYRSSAAILGIAFVNNIYGHTTMAALMIAGTVPIYNIAAVTVLSFTSPQADKSAGKKKLIVRTLLSVIKNPVIIGVFAGIIWSVIKIPQPVIFEKSISYLSNMATPLSLMALGASVKFREAKEKLPVAALITAIKLLLFCIIFLPIAVTLGFRDEKLIAILVMLGSSTTGSSFVMSKNFGHNGTITACAVMLTTLFSSFTLTAWLFILKTLSLI